MLQLRIGYNISSSCWAHSELENRGFSTRFPSSEFEIFCCCAPVPLEHPSISRLHAVLQFRKHLLIMLGSFPSDLKTMGSSTQNTPLKLIQASKYIFL